MELPAAGGTLSGAGRDGNPGVETEALARDSNRARKQGRTIVFINESGLSERPHRAHGGTERTEAGTALSLHLEEAFSDGRNGDSMTLSPKSTLDTDAPQTRNSRYTRVPQSARRYVHRALETLSVDRGSTGM